jgi:tetratricopeptide (TPR) repeat protein
MIISVHDSDILESISHAIELAKMGNSQAAANMIKEEFERLQSSGRLVELCEWLAICFEKLEDYDQAGSWYETAGEVILSNSDSQIQLRAIHAIREYEMALDCYRQSANEELIGRCIIILNNLKRSCASA